MNCSRFHDRTESFIIVNTFLLTETLGHQSSFMPSYRTIRMLLDSVDPFIANKILSRWERHQVPSTLCMKSINLHLHSKLPFRNGGSSLEGTGFNQRKSNRLYRGRVSLSFRNTILRPGGHWMKIHR